MDGRDKAGIVEIGILENITDVSHGNSCKVSIMQKVFKTILVISY